MEPYTRMRVYSFVGWLGSYSALQQWQTSGATKNSVYSGVDTSALLAIPALLMSAGPPPRFCKSDSSGTALVDLETYSQFRNSFYLSHGLIAVSELAMAASSSVDNRWAIAGLGILSPFIFDLIFRPLFYRERFSPWKEPPLAISVNDQRTPSLVWSESF